MPPARKRNAAEAVDAEAAGPRDVFTLEVIDGPAKGSVYTKQADKMQIGRTRTSQIHIKGDPAVSQKHAVISWNGKLWEIVDMGSSNGTVLNGVELEEEGDPVPLADGDTLIIGTDTTAKVKIVKAEAPKDESPPKAAKAAKKTTTAAATAAKSKAAAKEEKEEAASKASRAKAAAEEKAVAAAAAAAEAEEAAKEKEVEVAATEEEEEARVKVVTEEEEEINVEQFLSMTCDALVEAVQGDVHATIAQLKNNLTEIKAELVAACN